MEVESSNCQNSIWQLANRLDSKFAADHLGEYNDFYVRIR